MPRLFMLYLDFPESIDFVREVIGLLELNAIVVVHLLIGSSTAAVIDRIRDIRSDQRGENDDSGHGFFSFFHAGSGNCALFFEAAS